MKAKFILVGSEAQPAIEIEAETEFERDFLDRSGFKDKMYTGNPLVLIKFGKNE